MLQYKIPSLEYENIKEYLRVQLCDTELRPERHAQMVSTDLGNGFAMHYRITLSGLADERGIPSVLVTKELAEAEGYDLSVLHRDAMEASEKADPVHFTSVFEHLCSGPYLDKTTDPRTLADGCFGESDGLYMITTRSMVNGAAALYYPGVKESIARLFEGGYYVLPSSIHDLMILPERCDVAPEKLRETVKDINGLPQCLKPDEVLSDRILRYDVESKKLVPAIEEQRKRTKSRMQI